MIYEIVEYGSSKFNRTLSNWKHVMKPGTSGDSFGMLCHSVLRGSRHDTSAEGYYPEAASFFFRPADRQCIKGLQVLQRWPTELL